MTWPFDLPDWYRPTVWIDQLTAVFDAAKWFAHQAAQVYLTGHTTVGSGIAGVVVQRTVPTGKTMFITHVAWQCITTIDVPTRARVRVGATSVMEAGALFGDSIILDTAIRATEGTLVDLTIWQFSGSTLTPYGTIGGYDE